MYTSRSNFSGKTLEEDLESLYTSRPIDASERPTPRYSKPTKMHNRVPPISIPSTVRKCPTNDDDDSPARDSYSPTHSPRYSPKCSPRCSVPTQLVEKKKHNYVVPSKHLDDEPISPIYFVPKKGAMTAKTHNSKVTAIHGDASSFKYDKQKGKVHVMISGNAKTRFQTEDFEFVLEVGNQ